jgi:hypothetical protein
MRLTESHLRKIIKEELKKVLIMEEITPENQKVINFAREKFGQDFGNYLADFYNIKATKKIIDLVDTLERNFKKPEDVNKAKDIKSFLKVKVPEFKGTFATDAQKAAHDSPYQDPEAQYRFGLEEQERKPQGRAYGEPMNINPMRGLSGVSAVNMALLDAFQQIEKDYKLPTNSLVDAFAETRTNASNVIYINQLRSQSVGPEFEQALNAAATDKNGKRNLNDNEVKEKVLAAIQKYKPNVLKTGLSGKLVRGAGQFGIGKTKE